MHTNVQTHLFIYCNSGNYRVAIFASLIFLVIYYPRFQQAAKEEALKINRYTNQSACASAFDITIKIALSMSVIDDVHELDRVLGTTNLGGKYVRAGTIMRSVADTCLGPSLSSPPETDSCTRGMKFDGKNSCSKNSMQ